MTILSPGNSVERKSRKSEAQPHQQRREYRSDAHAVKPARAARAFWRMRCETVEDDQRRAPLPFGAQGIRFNEEAVMRRLMLTSKSATVARTRLAFLGGFGFGSIFAYMAAFFGDGRLGRRRRAVAGAKARHLARLGARRLGSSQRGALNHARGLLARLRTRLRAEPGSDEVILERVRAALGRASSHLSAIEVAVTDGRVALRGPILEREHRRVVRTARRVRGVRAIDDGLERHRRPNVRGLHDGPPHGARIGARPRRCTDIMKLIPQAVKEDDPLRLAAEIMAAANIGFLPVCDEAGKVVGTITDRDIVVRAVAPGLDPQSRDVGEVMSRNVVSCRPDDELALVEQFMAQYQVSRLVVTDADDVVQGVISLSDIAEHEPAARAARTLRSIAAREAARPS
jgi:CBS domain-containing protein